MHPVQEHPDDLEQRESADSKHDRADDRRLEKKQKFLPLFRQGVPGLSSAAMTLPVPVPAFCLSAADHRATDVARAGDMHHAPVLSRPALPVVVHALMVLRGRDRQQRQGRREDRSSTGMCRYRLPKKRC